MFTLVISGQGLSPFDDSQIFRPRGAKGNQVDMAPVLRGLSCRRVRDRRAGQGEARGRMGSVWCVKWLIVTQYPFVDPGPLPSILDTFHAPRLDMHDTRNRHRPLFASNSQRSAPPSREQTRHAHEHVRDRNSAGLRSMGPPSTGQRTEAVRRGRRRRRGARKEEEADCESGGVGRVGIGRVRSCHRFLFRCWLNVWVV